MNENIYITVERVQRSCGDVEAMAILLNHSFAFKALAKPKKL